MPDDVKLLIVDLLDAAREYDSDLLAGNLFAAAATALERLHRPVDREEVARAICIAMGDDPVREGPEWFIDGYGKVADAIVALLTTGGQVPAVPETHLF